MFTNGIDFQIIYVGNVKRHPSSLTHKKCKCFQGILGIKNNQRTKMKLLTVTYKIPGKPLHLVIRNLQQRPVTNTNAQRDIHQLSNSVFPTPTLTILNFH